MSTLMGMAHRVKQQPTIISGGTITGVRWAGGYQAADSQHTEPAQGEIWADAVGANNARISRCISNWYSDTLETNLWLTLVGLHPQTYFNSLGYTSAYGRQDFLAADAIFYAQSNGDTIWLWNGPSMPAFDVMTNGNPYLLDFKYNG